MNSQGWLKPILQEASDEVSLWPDWALTKESREWRYRIPEAQRIKQQLRVLDRKISELKMTRKALKKRSDQLKKKKKRDHRSAAKTNRAIAGKRRTIATA